MATGQAQHLVNALDQMIDPATDDSAPEASAEINQLDSLLSTPAAAQASEQPQQPTAAEDKLHSQLEQFAQENSYIDIDKLLNDSASEDDGEPYQNVDLDIGLDEFPEMVSNIDNVDVDKDPQGCGKKLDLARAYIEIDENDNAREMLEEVQRLGDEVQQKEAAKLLKKIKA